MRVQRAQPDVIDFIHGAGAMAAAPGERGAPRNDLNLPSRSDRAGLDHAELDVRRLLTCESRAPEWNSVPLDTQLSIRFTTGLATRGRFHADESGCDTPRSAPATTAVNHKPCDHSKRHR